MFWQCRFVLDEEPSRALSYLVRANSQLQAIVSAIQLLSDQDRDRIKSTHAYVWHL
jgi:hypothetical protein